MAETQLASHGELIVCASGDREFSARDVIDAAIFWGHVQPIWTEFLRGEAAHDYASERELEIEEGAIETAAENFRYEHDLITAEETEKWLTDHGLNLNDFSEYFARQYWGGAIEEKLETADVAFGSAPPELREAFIGALILSGMLVRWATTFIWRLAALSDIPPEEIDSSKKSEELRFFLSRTKITESDLKSWLSQVGRDEQWLDEMTAMEAAYRVRCQNVLSAEARKKEMSQMRLQLTRFSGEVIEVESQDAAKEALFCIKEDGMSMEEVASEGGYPYRTVSFLQEDVPDDLQQKFFSVVEGDVVDPLPRGDGFQLYRVTSKVEPNLEDAAVQQRIDERLLQRHFAELSAKHVQTRLSDLITE